VSFFDDGEDTAPRPAAARAQRPRAGTGAPPRRPRPRRPQHAGDGAAHDEHTVMVRRRVAAGAGVVLLIVIVLIVNGCLKSQQTQALEEYAHDVSTIATESEQQVSQPLFVALSGASTKSALDVEEQVDQLHLEAQKQATQAKGLSVPGEMDSAQRNLLLALDLRAEGVEKVAGQLRTALGGQAKQASVYIAGDMENFLASDVIYSQRVVPLIEQTLKSGGAEGQSVASSRFLPNIAWLESSAVQSRITGQSSAAAQSATLTGHHGSALRTVTVGPTALEPEPALNHISGGANPTFAVGVEDAGEFTETNVKVNVTVTAGGKQYKASGTAEKTEPGKTTNANVSLTGVPLGVAAKIEVQIEPVPGETDHEGTKGTYLAIFSS
jgi:hypothetical protein